MLSAIVIWHSDFIASLKHHQYSFLSYKEYSLLTSGGMWVVRYYPMLGVVHYLPIGGGSGLFVINQWWGGVNYYY